MKRLLSILVCLVLLSALVCIPIVANAQESIPMEIVFSASKTTYEAEDTINTTLQIKNNFSYPITNLTVLLDAPEGYQVANPEELPTNGALDAGKEASLGIKLVSDTADPSVNWVAILLICGGILVAGCILVLVRLLLWKKRKLKAAVSLVLACVLLSGMATMGISVKATEIQQHSIVRELCITIDGKEHTITATVRFDDNPLAGAITLDTSRMGYSQSQKAYTTTEEFDGFHGTLKDPSVYSEIRLEVYDTKDNLLQEHVTVAAKQWHFNQVGLCPGINRIRITVTGKAPWVLEFDLLDLYGNTYQLLEGYETDTDGDGIPDLVEINLATDPASADSDGDGVSDIDELKYGFDPSNGDSDGNNIPDGQEDADGDSISNSQELELGLSPILKDTDRDGIDDNQELDKYKTDPTSNDSDADGAPDGWEIDNGYDPAIADSQFNLSTETAPVSANNPVSAAVSMTVSGNEADMESLDIQSVTMADNPYISSCIAGYLGAVYDFTLDGSFDSATLTFRYDPALGTLGEDFDPKICYFNPDTNLFEPLPDQIVHDGVVTAQTTHFSIFSLLNMVDMQRCMTAAELQKNTSTPLGQLAKANIAIVMDNSASMAWNDPEEKSKEVAHYFIDHIRTGYDTVSLLTYTNTAQLLEHKTADREVLHKAVDNIVLDSGIHANSGTNGVAALNAAIDSLKGGSSNRYVLFFSDGDDTYLQSGYQQIVNRAISANVTILCVGFHTPENSYLKDLAESTNGHYYILDRGVNVEKAFGQVVSVFEAITPTEKDSNNDGISDFITKMIYEGKITLANGDLRLMHIDLNLDINGNPSDDFDGDGLKNGEEISLEYNPKMQTVYMSMSSHPCIQDSDMDGFDDKTERDNKSDPMKISMQQEPIDFLLGDDFYYMQVVRDRDPSYLPDGWQWLGEVSNFFFDLDTAVFAGGATKRAEIYYEVMTQYFLEYGNVAKEEAEIQSFLRNMIGFLDDAQSEYVDNRIESSKNITDSTAFWDLPVNTYKLLMETDKMCKGAKKLSDLKVSDPVLLQTITNNLVSLQLQVPIKWNAGKTTEEIFQATQKITGTASKAAEELGKVGDILTYAEAGIDLFNTCKEIAQIEANNELFLENLDILESIRKYSKNEHAVLAACEIELHVCGEFQDKFMIGFLQTIRDAYQFGLAMIPTIAKGIPVVGTFITILDAVVKIVNLLTKTGAEVQSTLKILCYHEIAVAHRDQAQGVVSYLRKGSFYSVTEAQQDQLLRNMTHLREIYKQAEKEYQKFFEITNIGKQREQENQKKVDVSIENVENAVDSLRSSTIYQPVYVCPDYGSKGRGGGGGGGHRRS